jgi:aryl-alcohol dehydrogenase-like predicted oxidoreductase
MGRALKDLGVRREDLVVSTKLFSGDANSRGPNDQGLSKKHIHEGLRNSLQRLKLDYVDIVIAHRPDHVTPIEETVRAFNVAIAQGHTLYWGHLGGIRTISYAPARWRLSWGLKGQYWIKGPTRL